MKYKKYTKQELEDFLEENFIEGFDDSLFEFIKDQKVKLEFDKIITGVVKQKSKAELIIRVKLTDE